MKRFMIAGLLGLLLAVPAATWAEDDYVPAEEKTPPPAETKAERRDDRSFERGRRVEPAPPRRIGTREAARIAALENERQLAYEGYGDDVIGIPRDRRYGYAGGPYTPYSGRSGYGSRSEDRYRDSQWHLDVDTGSGGLFGGRPRAHVSVGGQSGRRTRNYEYR